MADDDLTRRVILLERQLNSLRRRFEMMADDPNVPAAVRQHARVQAEYLEAEQSRNT